MEKRTMLALAALVAATSAFAKSPYPDFEFNRGGSTLAEYDWNTPSRWYVGSVATNSLPTKGDDVWLSSSSLRGKNVYIRTGTAAVCHELMLPNKGASLEPVNLIIDGGSLTAHGIARLAHKSCANLTIQNGGSLTAKSNMYIGQDNNESSGTKYVTNSVVIADSSSSLTTGTAAIYMGHQRKGQAVLVNNGNISFGASFHAGYCNVSGYALGDSVSIITNLGTISAAGPFRIGYRTNSIARVENTGIINITGSEFTLGHNPNAQGYFRHSAGNLSVSGSTYVGLSGSGYLELAGDTKTVLDDSGMSLAINNWQGNGSVNSYGELVITNSASLSRGGLGLEAASRYKYSQARIALYDDAVLSDIGTLCFGNVKTDNSFEVYDNAVVSNVDLFVLNAGSTSSDMEGKTTMKLSGNAKVCDIRNAYIGSNSYNRVELEIADNAWFGLPDDAWTTNIINVARDSYKSGDATIRMRGGMIGLGIRGGLVLGSPVDNTNVRCTSRIIGYGCVTNQGDRSKTVWSRFDIRGGSVTADGEGVERDLDLSTFARVSGSVGDGRSYLNVSGTNGWYAINKGRLIYPNMDGELLRFVGEYSRLTDTPTDTYLPKFVNAMKIMLKDSTGNELTNTTDKAYHRRFNVAMYAPNRTDIPAGLVEDDAKNRRLGIWKGNVTGNASGKFATAYATIRYDQWRLGELTAGAGNDPAGLEVRLYKHDGTAGGKWKKVSSYSAADAATNGYRISGDISNEVSGNKHNIAWFAVVAKEIHGSVLIVR